MGQIGFEGRFDYGAVGTVVNLADRLCGEAASGQILLSARAHAAVDGMFGSESVGALSLKGFHAPVPAFAISRFAELRESP